MLVAIGVAAFFVAAFVVAATIGLEETGAPD